MLESVPAKGEGTFLGTKTDILRCMTCLLQGGFVCLSIKIHDHFFSSLIILFASNDVSM